MTSSVAQTVHTSTATENLSGGYSYDVSTASNIATDASSSANPTSILAPADEVYALPNGSGLSDGNMYDAGSVMPVSQEVSNSDVQPNLDNSVSVETNPVAYSSANGSVALDNEYASGEPQYESHSELSSEKGRLWNVVKENSLDFDAWTALIQTVEKVEEVEITIIREVYDPFLVEFPLCYGYWKKYADHEARCGNMDKVVEVYERAVQAVTYSVDMWLHYCTFAILTYQDHDTIRRLFERGLAYVGGDYLSAPLWDKYIEYEYSQQQWSNLASIYSRILENPIQQLDRFYNSFKELATHRALSEIQTAEEVAAMVASVPIEIPGTDGIESEPNPVDSTVAISSKPVLTEAAELEKYMAKREEIYTKTKEYESKIIPFETAIRRPYFHVKPLDDMQLENWHNYIDFVERENDMNKWLKSWKKQLIKREIELRAHHLVSARRVPLMSRGLPDQPHKIVKLYERCLIACANYTEYWIRYVLCMEACGSMELAENALTRATQIFTKKQPDIHLFAARFKELTGDILSARAEYKLLQTQLAPGLLEAIIKHANMEYRIGEKEAAFLVYEDAISIERQKEGSLILSSLLIQYSRFLSLVAGKVDKAKELLDGSLEYVQLSKQLLEALIHLESIHSSPKRIEFLDSLVEKFVTSQSENLYGVKATDKEELSSIYLEFLDLFGDTQVIKKADSRHAKYFLRHKGFTTLGSRKRSAEDFLSSDRTKSARTAADASSLTQSVVGSYPNFQSQWPSAAVPQTQAWQQPQGQGQNWSASFNQQAAYGGYPGYPGFTNPQVPVAAPQTGAYGSYPSTYPSQQVYQAQAAPSYPAQLTTSQAQYYGNYY